MLVGLRTWWLAAIVTPFLQLYITPTSLLTGCLSELVITIVTIRLSVRRIGHIPVRRLLAGQASQDGLDFGVGQRNIRKLRWMDLILGLFAIAPAALLLAMRVSDDVQAGAFFAVGATSLIALLILTWLHLKAGQTGLAVALGRGNILRMALRNARRVIPAEARSPSDWWLPLVLSSWRSALFRVDPAQQTPTLDSGNGGFALVAESDQPIFHDLNSPEGRNALGFSPEAEKLLDGSTIFGLRVRPGDDASCLNLYQPKQPRLLGLPSQWTERGGFCWADKPRNCANPWLLLNQDFGSDARRRRPCASHSGKEHGELCVASLGRLWRDI